jgi:putative DNA primase/helicase
MPSVLKFSPKPPAADSAESEFFRVNTTAIHGAFNRRSTLIILRGNAEETRFDRGHWPKDIEKELREYLIVQAGEILEVPAGETMMGGAVPCRRATRWADFIAAREALQAAAASAPEPAPAPTPAADAPEEPEDKAEPNGDDKVRKEEAKPSGDDKSRKEEKAAPARSSLVMVRASDIRPESIQWVWANRFALGKFSLIAGNPGLGKSQLTVHMAAQITTGGKWPNGEGVAPFGSVIILSCEDDPADTLVPRLLAAGADTSRVHIVEAIKEAASGGGQERQFNLAKDVKALCDAIEQIGDVRLVIIDPVTAYLGNDGKVDSHKNAEVRGALAPLQSHAAKFGFAAVGVSHLNKGGGQEALMRVLGSLAFVAAARVAFLVVADADNERTLFIPMKNNIGVKRPGFAFRVVSKTIEGGIETSSIEWDADEITKSADEALAAAVGRDGDKGSERTSIGEAMNFLRDVLSEGPVSAKSVQHQAKEAGISRATLRRAQKAIGVKARHRGDGGTGGRGEWIWEMPEQIKLGDSHANEK